MGLTPMIHNIIGNKFLLLPQYARVYSVATRQLGGRRTRRRHTPNQM